MKSPDLGLKLVHILMRMVATKCVVVYILWFLKLLQIETLLKIAFYWRLISRGPFQSKQSCDSCVLASCCIGTIIKYHQAVGSLNNLRIRRTQEAQDWANPDFRLQDIPKAQAPFHTIDVWYCELLNSTYSSVNSTWFQTQFTFYKTVWCKLVHIWADLLEKKTEICSLSKKLCKSSYMLSAFCLWLVELSSLDCNIPNIFVL